METFWEIMRLIKIILPIIILSLIFSGCTREERQKKGAEIHFEAAQEYLLEKNISEAEKQLDTATEIFPEYVQAHILRQSLRAHHVSEELLLNEYEKFYKDNRKSAAFTFLYGRLLSDAEQQKLLYDKALELNPKFGWAYFGNAWIEYKKKRYAQAKELFLKAVELNPNNAIFYNNLGGVSFFLGEYDEAVDYLKKARSLDPNYARPYGNLATVYYQRGDFDSAENMLDNFLMLAPTAEDHKELNAKLDQLRGN